MSVTRPGQVGDTALLVADRNGAFMLRALTVGLGIATVVHHEILGDPSFFSLKNLAAGVAVVAILRPSIRTLLALLAAELVSIGEAYPKVYNHSVIIGAIAAGVLAYAAYRWIRRDREALEEAAFYRTIAPVVRVSALTAYVFAAFAKLNSGFFEGDTSCATKIYNDVVDTLPVLPRPGSFSGPLIYGTVAVEFAIPVLLAFRRTRLAGLAVGMSFHLLLIAGGHAPFTSAALAFYMGVFLPDDMRERLLALGVRRPALARLATSGRELAASTPALVGALLVWAAASILNTNTGLDPLLDRATAVALGLLVVALVVIVVLALLPGDGPRVPSGTLRPSHAAWLLLPLLLVVIALSPYVGLKTTASFTMYSNLRTEGDHWNHLVLPDAMQVFGYQDDLVTIVATNDPDLTDLVESGDEMVWFAFAEHRRANAEHEVTLVRDGETMTFRPQEVVGGSDAPPHALAKVMSFRDVSLSEQCQH